MKLRSLLPALAVVASFLLTLTGCGPEIPPGTIVKGRIVENGKPIPTPRADVGVGVIQIEIYPATNSTAKSGDATVANGEGEFELDAAGRGVEPGEYEMALLKPETDHDYFQGKFARGATPIKITVPADQEVVDLGDIDVADY